MIERFKELSVGYLAGNLSEQDAVEFARLYRSSSEYVKTFDEIERVYTAGLVIRYEGERTINYSIVKSKIAKSSKRRKIFAIISSVAAVLVVSLLATDILWRANETPIHKSEIISHYVSEDTHLILPDGSGVRIKAGSTLSFSPDQFEADRSVTLEGEACFDVRHDIYRPFIVKTSSLHVKVLGTVFNVNTMGHNAGVETTLARGSILIQDIHGEDVLFVHPGQQVIFENREQFIVNELRAWEYLLERYGTVTIPDAALTEIVGVLERVYGRRISVDIPKGACPIVTFGFNKGDDIREVLERLKMISGCGVSVLN